MPDVRPLLTQSLSFPDTSSSNLARPSKRRLASTPELEFFTPAASSFKPRPYTPQIASPSDPFIKPNVPVRSHARSHEAHALPPAGMDPQPTDPNVLFIHPPFVTFPNSHMYPDGLTYQLMAENPEWFLDADDFISQHNPNKDAIPYPPHLEPPRGWCPAKKKDLRDRGSGGWPEGGEPRLRCTFCRRTYAGVNAKSMWRRHVFEKHKIAMSNRRDGSERPRGRGSNKENKQIISKPRHEPLDSLLNMDVAPQTEPRNISHKSKFRSLLPLPLAEEQLNPTGDLGDIHPAPSSPKVPPTLVADGEQPCHHPLSQSHVPPLSPPLTPQSSLSSDPASVPLESDPPILPISPTRVLPVVPPSPYDPLLTPSFRHSPPRLPSDQPWRFPSPSHPLHSRSRELSLSMLIRDLNSPINKGSLAIGESPRMIQASPMPSPRVFNDKGVLDLGTPESMAKLPKPSPRALFARGRLSAMSDRVFGNERKRHRIEESPLHRNSRMTSKTHKRSESELTDDWLSGVPLMSSKSSLDASELLSNGDPFVTIYSSWNSISSRHANSEENPGSPATNAETESPVLRNSTLPTGVGLGIGLLGPFTLSEDNLIPVASDNDFDNILSYPALTDEEGDEAEVACSLEVSGRHNVEVFQETSPTPPLKKRRKE